MAELRYIIKNPVVVSATVATGGVGGTEEGYNVVFKTGQDAVWIEKVVFEANFGHVTDATGLSFPSALALLQEGVEIERVAYSGLKKLIEFKNPDRFNYTTTVGEGDDAVDVETQVADPRGLLYANGNQVPETRFMHIDCHEAISNAPRRGVWNATARDMTATDWKAV